MTEETGPHGGSERPADVGGGGARPTLTEIEQRYSHYGPRVKDGTAVADIRVLLGRVTRARDAYTAALDEMDRWMSLYGGTASAYELAAHLDSWLQDRVRDTQARLTGEEQ